MLKPKTKYVRKRPHRGNEPKQVLRGVIYLTGDWVGRRVKIVRYVDWIRFMSEFKNCKTKLRRINRLSNQGDI